MPELSREFRGIWFPREVWLDGRLTALEKIILLEVDSLDGPEGCYASNEHLAEFCQCSKNKVVEAISKLKKLGYVSVESFDGRKRTLRSNLHEPFDTPQNREAAYPENGRQTTRKMGERILVENTKGKKKENTKERNAETRESIIGSYTDDPELLEAIYAFIEMRKASKSAMTDHAVKLMLSKLDKLAADTPTKIAVLNQSTLNCWKGLYALKEPWKEANFASYSEYRR